MIYYKEARRIFFTAEIGEEFFYELEDYKKVQQSLNVVKRQNAKFLAGKKFKTKKGKIWRIS